MPARSHGMKNTKLYRVWNSMKERCRNPNNRAYKNYGGRGIKMCNEWLYSFRSFYDWCNSSGYTDGVEIDRIDNDGNYEPTNCRLVTPKINGNNRRTNKLITIQGVTRTLSEWSDVSGVNRMTITSRIKNGWNENRWLEASRKRSERLI